MNIQGYFTTDDHPKNSSFSQRENLAEHRYYSNEYKLFSVVEHPVNADYSIIFD